MFRRLRQGRFLSLAFLLLLLGSQVSSAFAGLNLCIGAQGHVEIEAREAGCCPSQQASGSETIRASAEGDCESCIDISLGSDGPEASARPDRAGFQGPLFPLPVVERIAPLSGFPAVRDAGPVCAPSLAAIRTIVLRV